jgi:uncharacterized protein YutE (UPF0331/DUF86 family)
MTEPILVLRKLTILREHVDRLRRRRPSTVEAFRADLELQDAAALSLLVSIQEALDISLHIAADEGWGLPSSYAEAFQLIAQHGVIPGELAGDLGRLAALRNRIAHGYGSLDQDRIWSEIPAGLEQLERFVAAVAAFADT